MEIKQNIISHYNGQDIIEYQMIMANGFQVNFLNYGCIITAIFAPDKNNHYTNVVLKHAKFNPENPGHFGALTGRVAGRIASAQFELDNNIYKLMPNNKMHNLHGGPNGLDKQIWNVQFVNDGAILNYLSPDNESGFPSSVEFIVEYLITQENSLTLNYYAKPSSNTIINLTNHSYFDLSGGINPLNQQLQINADYYAEIDTTGIVSGVISSVADTPFDFRRMKMLHSGIVSSHPQIQIANGYDHPLILKDQRIILTDPLTKRQLDIITDQDVCVLYSANHIKHSAICLETQAMPNAINWPEYRESVIYTPHKPYNSHNVWQFSVTSDE